MSDRNSPFSFCVIFISHWRNIDYIEVGQIKKKKRALKTFPGSPNLSTKTKLNFNFSPFYHLIRTPEV